MLVTQSGCKSISENSKFTKVLNKDYRKLFDGDDAVVDIEGALFNSKC